MKSKKISSNKPGWNLYNKTDSHSNPIPLKENTLVSHSLRETATDIFMSIDLFLTDIPLNPVNRKVLQALLPISQSLPFSQHSVVSQLARVNVFVARQLTETNMFVPQGQGIDDSIEPILETLTISYNDNQLVDPYLWNGIFTPISLLGIKKFLSSNA